ncbi:MAG: nucleotidyltransferase domain-containing protein [candidate division KSB1 bacterium]|nr:nucleotidyltransferase domain-containing protein [candidate division KSB1 bacterium]MDZ7304901.1 nucleotidyltransferase domain-containing protein [candidate division KSB1 bacterium]MDZ7313963.1 nucleotidyltransferase domain-containing protein [candidate division KSB1 bacterium]
MKEFPRNIQDALRYLREQVQQNGAIVLFGSRVSKPSKKNADFDIGLFMQKPLSWKTFSVWKTRAEDLAWPYRIDLVDLGRAPSEFLDVIEKQMIVLHGEWHGRKGIKRETRRNEEKGTGITATLGANTSVA